MASPDTAPHACQSPSEEISELRMRLADAERRLADAQGHSAMLIQRVSMAGDGRLRQILESAIDYAIIGMDLDGLVTAWNEGARRILGWTEAEMVGQPASKFFTYEDRQQGIPQSEMQAALVHERGSDERWHQRKDGSRFWANGEMMPLKDEAGAVHGFVKILRDRTEQRLAHERHHADSEFMRRVLASSGDCIKVLDLEANLTFMSEGGMRVMEVSDFNAIRGCPWPDFWRGPMQQDARQAIETSKAGGIGQFQGLAPTMAGTPKYWDVQVTPMLDAGGKPERLLVVSRDITEARRAELQRAGLLELSDRLRGLDDPTAMAMVAAEILAREFGAASAGYATIDAGLGIISVALEWAMPGATTSTPRFADAIRHLRILRQGKLLSIREDGRSILALPASDHDVPNALFFLTFPQSPAWSPEEASFARDLVNRTSAALKHRRTEQQMRELAASLERQVEERTRERDRIWRVSRDLLGVATESGVWISINPAWTANLGWAEADIVGRSYEWMTHPDDLPKARLEAASLASGNATLHFENRVKTAAGDYRWLSWSAVPVEGLWYCVGRDITVDKEQSEALQKTEEQLRQSQKMEAVGQLTGGIAHDFNNLLTGISGSLELIKLRMAQGRMTNIERYITVALGATNRAAALTHRLLAFSRQQALHPTPTDANRLVAGMKDLIRRTVGPEIKLETIPGNGLCITLCDPNQLENAILNLAINARDAMPEGGRLTIETAEVDLDPNCAPDLPPGPYVVTSVTDSGTGMPPGVIARAFDPFFTTKPLGQGTGLGLSMIYGFVKQSGGQVRITSTVGQGTAVHMYLPRHLGEAGATEPAADPAAALRALDGETVLIVDDEPSVRMLITDVLEELGYAVIAAADGSAGLKVLRSDARIDLLITDIGLPGGMNGRQLAEAGRVARPHLKVLFVTGYAETAANGTRNLEPGMATLAKPFAIDTLTGRIKAIIMA